MPSVWTYLNDFGRDVLALGGGGGGIHENVKITFSNTKSIYARPLNALCNCIDLAERNNGMERMRGNKESL